MTKKKAIQLMGLLVGLLFTTLAYAQQSVSTTQLLQQAWTQPATDARIQFLDTEKQTLPVVEKLEVRTETDEFDWERQELTFRTSFNGFKARKAQQTLVNKTKQKYETQNRIAQQELMATYYQLLLAWHYEDKEIALLQAQQRILEDKKRLFEAELKQNTQTISIENYLKIEKDLYELGLSQLKAEQKKLSFIKLLGLDVTTAYQLDTTDWVTVAQMQAIIAQGGADLNQHPDYAYQQAKVDFAQAEWGLEKANAQKVLDFAQVRYASKKEFQFNTAVSVGVGINLPFTFASRVDLNEAQLDVLEETEKVYRLEEELAQKQQAAVAEFEANQQAYAYVKAYIENNEQVEVLEGHLDNANVSLWTILELKEDQLDAQEELLDLEYKLSELYLEILELRGALSGQINYLSDDLRAF